MSYMLLVNCDTNCSHPSAVPELANVVDGVPVRSLLWNVLQAAKIYLCELYRVFG